MALIKCKDCGNDVSTEAKSCPQCGRAPEKAQRVGLGTFALGALVAVGILVGINRCGSSDSPTQAAVTTPPALSDDARAVRHSFDQMSTIEKAYTALQEDLQSMGDKTVTSTMNKHDVAERMRNDIQRSNEILDHSASIQVPQVAQPDGLRYITQAVDAHKQWAIMQQAKLGALLEMNRKMMQQTGDEADQFAAQEAVSLMLAFKAVGLPPE